MVLLLKKIDCLKLLIVVFGLFLLGGCSKPKSESITLAVDKHPVCQIDYTDVMEKCQTSLEEMRNYFDVGEEFNDFSLALDGKTCFSFSQYANKLYIAVFDEDLSLVNELHIEFDKSLFFFDFAVNDHGKMVGLAYDNNGNISLCELEQNAIRSIQTVDSDNFFDSVDACGNDFILTGDSEIKIVDENLFEKGLHRADIIYGITFSDDKFFVLENNENGLELVTLNKTNCKVTNEYRLDFSDSDDYLNILSVSMISVDESTVLMSYNNAVYCLDLANKSSEVMLNSLDMGFDFLYLTSFDGESIKALTSYQDLFSDEYKVISTDIKLLNEADRTSINVAMLYDYDMKKYFQYINRNSDDFYISITDYTDSYLSDADYAELITNTDIDMMVFDDYFRDSLVNNDYLINLNDNGMNVDSQYYVYPSYSMHLYFYNPANSDGNNDIKQILDSDSHIEIFANQKNDMLAEEYSGVISQEYETTGKISTSTCKDFLSLYSSYDNSYFEEDTMINEIKNGSFLFLNTQINSLESLYSIYCYYNGSIGFCGPFGYSKPVAVPEFCIGITSTSSKVEMCKNIISILMSEDVQRAFDLPYDKKVMDEKIDNFISLLDEKKASSIVINNPLTSDADLVVFGKELTQIIDSMQDETLSVEDENYSINNLPKGLKVLTSQDELNAFSDFAEGIFGDYELSKYRYDELISIMDEEAKACCSNGGDIDHSTDVLYERLKLYISENW